MANGPRVRDGAILAMLVLVLVPCGCCNLDYVPNHDIVVFKLAPDGTLEWTRVVDHGSDDAGKDLVELPDGGFAIAGQTSSRPLGQPHSVLSPPQPLLVRLSPGGAVEWDRLVTDGFDVANAVVSAGDGGTAVLTGNGTVVRYDGAGQVLWRRTTGIPEAHALVLTADGGYLAGGRLMYEVPVNSTAAKGTVARLPVVTTATERGDGPLLAQAYGGVTTARTLPTTPQLASVPRRFDLVRKAMVVRLGADGALEWECQYDEGGLMDVLALTAGAEGTGFLLAGEGAIANSSSSRPLTMLLSLSGTPGPAIPIGEQESWPWSISARSEPRGYRILSEPLRISQENYFRGAVDTVLDRDGRVLDRVPLDASLAVTWTSDGGYASVGIPPDGGSAAVCGWPGACSYMLRSFDGRGAVVADYPFLDVAGAPFDRVQKVVQTADGGYAVLASRQNR